MPRQTHDQRAIGQRGAVMSPAKSSMRSPVKLPFNDDQQEKSVRFQSRQALHDLQMNSIKAAASPIRKRRSLGPANSGSPRTPRDDDEDKENDDSLHVVSGTAVTPMKRVPILANFEEWMKMATDNKINATNSWNFALIDYFHDMSLLREGDSVNFQKASCTLDGCVKIYTSRVDSVATETGKLLSGLADSAANNKKKRGDEDGQGGEDEDDDEEEGEDGTKKRVKKKSKTAEATLAPSFAQLQLKKMELEFAVDPLFKKASADFDEGGAKGLLLNHLTIDGQGRIVFDSSDNTQDASESPEDDEVQRPSSSHSTSMDDQEDAEIDIDALGQRFFPNLDKLDEQDICPSLKTFEVEGASDSMNIPFLKAADDWKKDQEANAMPTPPPEDGMASWNDDDDGEGLGGFDVAADVGFGEGGEAWAKDAAIHTQQRPFNASFDVDGEETGDGEVGGYDPESAQYGVTLGHSDQQDNILAYFDQALSKNWAGPEHWRIRKIKDASKPGPARTRKEKEPFEIDFAAPLTAALADAIYTPAATASAISLPKSQWKSRTRNLLPDDKHFNSKSLLSLFLKPKARIGARKRQQQSSGRGIQGQAGHEEMDGAFWAQHSQEAAEALAAEAGAAQGDYDANFFQDDGLGLPPLPDDDDDDDAFADAQEHLGDSAGGVAGLGAASSQAMPGAEGEEGGFGTNLVTQSRRLRPEYVQYARVAKKVDVRRLKEEMWRGIGYADETTGEQADAKPETEEQLKFTDVMNGLQKQYPKQAMADISTSYCFICLLHLANEKGLVIENQPGFEELSIRRDYTADLSGEGGA